MTENNEVQVFGIRADGTEVLLGKVEQHPAIKRREIVANYFNAPTDDKDDCSESNMCLWALEDYHSWLVQQGWTGPKLKISPMSQAGNPRSNGD